MHIELLVEERSAEAALCLLVPRIVGPEVTFDIHVFQGKHDLLKKLPDRLRGYRSWNWKPGFLVMSKRFERHTREYQPISPGRNHTVIPMPSPVAPGKHWSGCCNGQATMQEG